MQKCYGVTIKDKAQDVRFRCFIENIARSNYLEGIIFNYKDGSVKLIIRGDNSVVDDFFDDIKAKGNKRGIILEIKEKKELELDIPLPPIFSKVSTDDEQDIGRKLYIGNNRLDGINEKLVSVNGKLTDITEILRSMNNTLQKIADK